MSYVLQILPQRAMEAESEYIWEVDRYLIKNKKVTKGKVKQKLQNQTNILNFTKSQLSEEADWSVPFPKFKCSYLDLN